MKNLDPFHNITFGTHFPVSIIIEYLWTLMDKKISFIIYLFIFITYYVYYNYKFIYSNSEKRQSIISLIIISFLSYPFIFAIDRGNIEIYLYLFLSLFFYFYYIKKNEILSIVFLSIAIGMKLFPAVFLVILFKDKQYKQLFLTIVVTIVLSIGSLSLVSGALLDNIKLFISVLSNYSQLYIIGSPGHAAGLGFNNSLFGFIRLAGPNIYMLNYYNNAEIVLRAYLIFSLFFFSLISLYILLKENVLWKQIALLVFCMNLLPYVSADYKLIHIYIPLLFFLISKENSSFDRLYAFLFGFLLIPKAYYIISKMITDSGRADINIGVILNPLLMISFCMLIIWEGLFYKKEINSGMVAKV